MKIHGKKQHPILGEIDDVEMEESDFDFSKQWEDLDINKKADFCSFIKAPFLSKDNEHIVKGWWEYYQKKNQTKP